MMLDVTPPAEGDSRDAEGPEGPPEQPQQPSRRETPDQRGETDEQSARQDLAQQGPPEQPVEEKKPQPNVVARYGLMGHLGAFACTWKELPEIGDKVVLRTERGVELGEVVTLIGDKPGIGCVCRDRLDEFIAANGPDYPFRRTGKVLRAANQQDIIDHRHLESSASDEAAFCREQIRQLGLEMKLVAVEHLLGGERIIFYFTAESRVDFRELVRGLASQYHTRIEMRQVGARDEARLVGDYERCGRRCCCQTFLKYLQPVSMRMAKTQKATLDPSKISGRCGRLMCCLRFEDEGYEQLRARLPRKNSWVKTRNVIGRVVDVQILTQLVKLSLPDGSQIAVANEEIVEQDASPPPEPVEKPEAVEAPAEEASVPVVETAVQSEEPSAPEEVEIAASAETEQVPAAPEKRDEQRSGPKKGRRRRRRKKQSPAAQSQPQTAGQPQNKSAKKGRSRRGRRGRRKRKSEGQGQSGFEKRT
ncbi:MAG: PSP1 domain-containing protein [Planctomycetota bacterium]|jgi:cell fate regulator YaaT (PSP1 superfamily)